MISHNSFPAADSLKTSPLYVDLDGTLAATDTLWESLIQFLKSNPLNFFLLFRWLLRGKVYFKNQLAGAVQLDPATLPYREEVLAYIRKARGEGCPVILATASHQSVADKVAGHLNLFSGVLATDSESNLSGKRKLKAIQAGAGHKPFRYMGDAAVDIPIWEAAESAIIVNPSRKLMKQTNHLSQAIIISTGSAKGMLYAWLKALRVHQWSKNILLFVPLVMAHRLFEMPLVLDLLLAFISFSLSASAVYILNDIIDLQADRQHPTKKQRPFASGALSIQSGLLALPLLIAASFGIALFKLPLLFSLALGFYLLFTTSYSFYLKRQPIIDVITLASLYTFRMFAGALAVSIPISFWLLAFSMFFFLCLAFMKRYNDLLPLNGQERVNGRGYIARDVEVVLATGIASGYISLLVFALYLNSEHVKELYPNAILLWLIIPFLFYWITRMWLLAHRGKMNDDPVIFALKDRPSYIIYLAIALILLWAKSLSGIPFLKNILLM